MKWVGLLRRRASACAGNDERLSFVTARFPRILERKHYSELRRRIIRGALQPLFHAGNARLSPITSSSGADIRRILVCRPNHRLGNLLLLTPLLAEIQWLFPDAEVDIVLAGEHVAELFRSFPNVKHVYVLSRRMARHPLAVMRTALEIRRARYDLAIDPCEASQSARLLVIVAGAKHVLGTPRGGAGMTASASMANAPAHMAQWPVHLLRRASGSQSPEHGEGFPVLDIRLSDDERQRARATLERVAGRQGPGFVIGVFAEATGAKGYGPELWRQFICIVRTQHPDAAIVEIAPADGRPRLADEIPSFASPSPREVAAVIANMTCFVSADCGIMHLASASGTPTIGLFSVTDASRYAPYGHGSGALDTNEKSPEAVAREASMLIRKIRAGAAVGPRDCFHGVRFGPEGTA